MEKGDWPYFWPRTPSMAVSEASVDIWKGRDQSRPLNIGSTDNLAFRTSKAL